MSSQIARPKWWQVYLSLPLLVGLFALDSRLKMSARGHQAVQIGIVLIVYLLIHLWLKANAPALSGMDRKGSHGSIRVLQIRPAQLPGSERQRLIQLSDSEIKGMLSNTIEMDYIDSEFVVTQEEQQVKEQK